MQEKFKILSLDGGGTWSIIQLLTLKERYGGNKKGHDLLKDYDLVISNSGGSLVLAVLCCNWTLDKGIQFFDDLKSRERIFSRNGFFRRYFPTNWTRYIGFGPKYSTAKKYEALQDIFKEIDGLNIKDLPETIGENAPKIVISNYDAITNRAKFFKTYKGSSDTLDSVNLIDVVHGSSNPPVNYFDFPAKFKVEAKNTATFFAWDGALGGFNNPVTAGIIEAIDLKVPKKNICIVSLGTYNKMMSLEEKKKFELQYEALLNARGFRFGRAWNFFKRTTTNLAKSILYEPPDWANYVAYIHRFDGSKQHEENIRQFVRLSPMIYVKSNMSEENKRIIAALNGLDLDLIHQGDVDWVKKCFDIWKKGEIDNQPIRGSIDANGDLKHKIGFKTFGEGMEAWLAM